MDYHWNIAGHKKQLEFLSNSIKTGKLAHAYLFAGPSHIGKRAVAENFAKILLCEGNTACGHCGQCRTFIAASNADYVCLDDPEKIKIEEIRELIYKLSLKPYMAKHKIAIIDGADSMTIEASNALLKSLEEPKSYTVIILISANPHRLPATILSRVQKISFGPVPESEFNHLLDSGSENKDLISKFAAGRPGLAISISRDEEFAESISELEENFKTFRDSTPAERLLLALKVADMETVDIQRNLDFWLSRLDTELKEAPSRKIAVRLSRLIQARQHLDQNANSKLLMFDLMLKT
jgi:DNA polymerase III subunit delta'